MEVRESKFYKSKWSGRIYAVRDASHLGVFYLMYLEDFLGHYKAGAVIRWGTALREEFKKEFIPATLAEILYA